MRQPAEPVRVRVRLPASSHDRSYDAAIGAGVLESLGAHVREAVGLAARRTALIIDTGVRAHGHDPTGSLRASGFEVIVLPVTPTERDKSIDTLASLLRGMAQAMVERGDVVVAVGGGVTGDLGGLAAGLYRRGIAVVQCPTTLLAMVDAAVGGKTAVNLPVGPPGGEYLLKNAVGVFHQPRVVLIDPNVLSTLPPRHVGAGLAECIKHAMIGASVGPGHADLLGWTRANLAAARRDGHVMAELIRRNVALKAEVVAWDEHEQADDETGGRALLNLGHTFGHVLEVLPGLSMPDGRPVMLLHGEAVGLGLRAAAVTAQALGMTGATGLAIVDELLEAAGLPSQVRGLPDTSALVAAMAHDKKARGGAIRVILPTGPGQARVVASPDPAALAAGFDGLRG